MKPSFALNFTDDGITLLHRTARGWISIGATSFSEPDLDAALEVLLSTARSLDPECVRSLLLIPPSQIRYFELEAAGPDDQSRHAQILAALEGRTPYAVEELAFDWQGEGPQVTVAVVARETLSEAEGFAASHDFAPVAFATLPPQADQCPPFFGATAIAEAILGSGAKISREDQPISVLDAAPAAVTEAAPSLQAAAFAASDAAGYETPATDLPAAAPPEIAPEGLPETPSEIPSGLPEVEIPQPAPMAPDLPPAELPVEQPQEYPAPQIEPDMPQPDLPPAPDYAPAPETVPTPKTVPEPEAPAPDLPQPDLAQSDLVQSDLVQSDLVQPEWSQSPAPASPQFAPNYVELAEPEWAPEDFAQDFDEDQEPPAARLYHPEDDADQDYTPQDAVDEFVSEQMFDRPQALERRSAPAQPEVGFAPPEPQVYRGPPTQMIPPAKPVVQEPQPTASLDSLVQETFATTAFETPVQEPFATTSLDSSAQKPFATTAFETPVQDEGLAAGLDASAQQALSAPVIDVEEAPMAIDVEIEPEELAKPILKTAYLPPLDDVPAAPPSLALTAFASRRKALKDSGLVQPSRLTIHPRSDLTPPEEPAPRVAPPRVTTPISAPLEVQPPVQQPVIAPLEPTPPPAPLNAAPSIRPIGPKPSGDRTERRPPKFGFNEPPMQRPVGDVAAPPVLSPPPQATAPAKGLRGLSSIIKPAAIGTSISGARGKATMPQQPPMTAKDAAPRDAGPVLTRPAAPVNHAPLNTAAFKAAAVASVKANPARPETRSTTSSAPDDLIKGLSARNMTQPNKPKHLGLILTALLLLILAAIAAWSSYTMTQSDGTEETAMAIYSAPEPSLQTEAVPAQAPLAAIPAEAEGQAVAEAQSPLPAPATEAQAAALLGTDLQTAAIAPTIEDEALADGQGGMIDDEALADGQDPAEFAAALAVNASPAPVVAAPAAAPEAQLLLAALTKTSIPTATPLSGQTKPTLAATTQPQDEVFVSGMDTPPPGSEPLAMAQPNAAAERETPPMAPVAPPPFGTVYKFDAEGRIAPTKEGAVTPDGVTLVDGRPKRLPPARPSSLSEAPAQAAAAAAAVDDAAALKALVIDPVHAKKKPKLRPADLAVVDRADVTPTEPAAVETAEAAFEGPKPKSRPPTLLAAGEAARRESEAASLAANAAVAAAIVEASQSDVSPLAIAVSRTPAARPRSLATAAVIVPETTRQAAAAAVAPASTVKPSRTAPAAPEATEEEGDDEPEVQPSKAPRIPIKAGLAKQATYAKALNLSKVNLIGVYGTPAKRYAMVRQSNGRYTKVKVGDSVDGGKVQAITATELRYQKGKKLMTLAMPAS